MDGFSFIDLTKPFIGHHDWNGVFYANIARNFLRYGWATKLGQVTDFGWVARPENFYTHYPPLLTWGLAGWFKVFGIGDWQARLFPLVFHLGSLWLMLILFHYWRYSFWQKLAGLAVVLTPMWRYFAVMPSQEALIIFFSWLSLVAFCRGQKKLFYAAVVLNGLSGWAGYLLYPWLLLLKRRRRWLVNAGLILTAVFLVHLSHTAWLTGSPAGGGLFEALKLRLNLAGTPGFSWSYYLILERRRLAALMTGTLLIVAGVGLIWRRRRLTWVCLGWGLSYPLIFSNVVFIHDYFNIYLLPFLALAAADFFGRRPKLLVVIFLLAVFWERQSFYQVLAKTAAFLPGQQLGRKINREVPAGKTAYVLADRELIKSQNLFISYYADRKVIYLNSSQDLPSEAEYVFNELR
jgi:hypothetical protein